MAGGFRDYSAFDPAFTDGLLKGAPEAPISVSYEDDAGNKYDEGGNIVSKGTAPGSMSWGETALTAAAAPATFGMAVGGAFSPYAFGERTGTPINRAGPGAPIKGGSVEGWRVPPIIGEPIAAGGRLLNSGGFPDPQDPQNQQDAVTSLLSFFGANALNPATKLPAGAVGMFAGRKAKTADHAALARAEQMASTGADRNAIWNETGWFQGPDKQWRFEIDDSGAAMAKPLQTVREQFGREAPLDMSFEHAKLFDAYPEARDITYYPTTDYRPGEASFGASVRVPGEDGPAGRIRVGYDETNPFASHMAAPSSTLHELQHYIQRVGEGNFATGGSPKNFAADVKAADEMINTVNQNMRSLSKQMDAAKAARDAPLLEELSKRYDDLMGYKLSELVPRAQIDPVDQYKRLAGEVEARNVQTRMNMSADQRKATPPWETQDVPDADQIIRLLSDTSRPSVMGSAIGSKLATEKNYVSQDMAQSVRPEMRGEDVPVQDYGSSAGMRDLQQGQGHVLDMSDEARLARARELGFDVDNPWYHATRQGNAFDEFKSNSNGLVYFASDPSSATIGASAGAPHDVGAYYLRYSNPFNDPSAPIHWMDAQSYRAVDRNKNVLDATGSDAVFVSDEATGKGARSIAVLPSQIRSVNAAFDPARAGENGLLLSDTSRPSLLGSAVAAEQAPTKGITAYHGSPHDFDKFDMSKIGSGEGAQAYGHGLYFAESEGVAKSYRNALSGAPLQNPMKDDITPPFLSAMKGRENFLSLEQRKAIASGGEPVAMSFLNDVEQRLTGERSRAGKVIKGRFGIETVDEPSQTRLQLLEEERDALKSLIEAGDYSTKDNMGHMYQVRINADPNDFLDWDNPLSQQSEKIRAAFPEDWGKMTGNDAYDMLGDHLLPDYPMDESFNVGAAMDKAAFDHLRQKGIAGTKYLDQMSRNAGEGSRNYVVFNQEIIDILKKYGMIPGLYGSGQVGQERQ